MASACLCVCVCRVSCDLLSPDVCRAVWGWSRYWVPALQDVGEICKEPRLEVRAPPCLPPAHKYRGRGEG